MFLSFRLGWLCWVGGGSGVGWVARRDVDVSECVEWGVRRGGSYQARWLVLGGCSDPLAL